MNMKNITLAFAFALSLLAVPAGAATLDFGSLGSGDIGTNVINLPEATVTSAADSLFVGANFPGSPGSICALNSVANSCANDLTIDFTAPVFNLMFEVGGWQQGDSIVVSIFDSLNLLLGTASIGANGSVDLSSFGTIASLFFDDSSSAFGVDYGEFSFDVSPVPLPAALPLFAAALGGAGFVGWRRRRRETAAA